MRYPSSLITSLDSKSIHVGSTMKDSVWMEMIPEQQEHYGTAHMVDSTMQQESDGRAAQIAVEKAAKRVI